MHGSHRVLVRDVCWLAHQQSLSWRPIAARTGHKPKQLLHVQLQPPTQVNTKLATLFNSHATHSLYHSTPLSILDPLCSLCSLYHCTPGCSSTAQYPPSAMGWWNGGGIKSNGYRGAMVLPVVQQYGGAIVLWHSEWPSTLVRYDGGVVWWHGGAAARGATHSAHSLCSLYAAVRYDGAAVQYDVLRCDSAVSGVVRWSGMTVRRWDGGAGV